MLKSTARRHRRERMKEWSAFLSYNLLVMDYLREPRCIRCNRRLKLQESIQRGMGRVCSRHKGGDK